MKNIELLPHNEVAYQELLQCLLTNQLVSLNRATGTGKSFILSKFLYKNKNKRILYLAPSYPIIDQLVEEHFDELGISLNDFSHFDTMIYRTLLNLDMACVASNYDIIILDEYHRCGALKSGIKVSELLRIIKERYPNTKVVGTTATEIRYLDNERNMNNILFGGVEASRLTLADAILNGILPAPVYVNFNYNLLNDLDDIIKNIDRYTFYESDKIRYLKEVKQVRNEIEQALNYQEKLENYIKDSKKFLVFSSNINNIDKNKLFMEKFLKHVDHSYIIHSKRSNEQNKQALKEFRNVSKDDISVLYSVNILNEGVHVKDVDVVCMMRPTTSPIIYFQHLGRLLSYSRRNDVVIVLDFVNNIKNNPVIYELYQDVFKRAKELMALHPENKELYELVLKNFRIVDETSKLCEKIDYLKTFYSKDKILERRLLTAISILEDVNNQEDVLKFQAYIDIIKYESYITIDMFDRIKKLENIDLPIMEMSREDFLKYLGKSKNMREENTISVKKIYKQLYDFVDYNYRLPSIFSQDSEEVYLAKLVINNFYKFSMVVTNYIKSNISNELSLFERITYGEKPAYIDEGELLKEAEYAYNLGCVVKEELYLKLMHKVNGENLNTLNNIKFDLDSIDNELLLNRKSSSDAIFNNEIIFRRDFELTTSKIIEELKSISVDEYVNKLFKDIYEYMSKHKKDLEYSSSNRLLSPLDWRLERELFCKKIVFHNELKKKGYLDILDKLILDIKTNKLHYMISQKLEELLMFIDAHQGALPSARNKWEKEVLLAKFYTKNERHFRDIDRDKIKKIQEKYPNRRIDVLNQYISFIEKNGRKPMFDNTDNEEIELNEEFNRWSPFFNEEERIKLNLVLKSINKYDAIRKTYLEYKMHKNRN